MSWFDVCRVVFAVIDIALVAMLAVVVWAIGRSIADYGDWS